MPIQRNIFLTVRDGPHEEMRVGDLEICLPLQLVSRTIRSFFLQGEMYFVNAYRSSILRHSLSAGVWSLSRRGFSTSSIVMQHKFTSSNIVVEGEEGSKQKKKSRPRPRTMESLSREVIVEPPRKDDWKKKLSNEPLKTKRIDAIDAVNTGKHIPEDWRKMKLPDWKRQKYALAEKFDKWNPNKKLSREQMESVRVLKSKLPELTASQLSSHFQVSVEAIRRILRSEWTPKAGEEEEEVMERWKKRKDRVKTALGMVAKNKLEDKGHDHVVVLDTSRNEYTSVKSWKDRSLYQKKTEVKKTGGRSRMFKAEKKQIRKMEF